MNAQNDEGGLVTGINITPMVDIMLVLLIIFMVTAHFVSQTGVKVNLPNAANSKANEEKAPVLVIDKFGNFYLEGKKTTIENIKFFLKSENSSGYGKLVIKADKSVVYSQVIKAIDAAKSAGINKISLATEK